MNHLVFIYILVYEARLWWLTEFLRPDGPYASSGVVNQSPVSINFFGNRWRSYWELFWIQIRKTLEDQYPMIIIVQSIKFYRYTAIIQSEKLDWVSMYFVPNLIFVYSYIFCSNIYQTTYDCYYDTADLPQKQQPIKYTIRFVFGYFKDSMSVEGPGLDRAECGFQKTFMVTDHPLIPQFCSKKIIDAVLARFRRGLR